MPLEQVAPKEKTELERAKEEAEARAKREAEEAASGSPGGKSSKKKKKVGFATTSASGFAASGSNQVAMRTRPILSDEHEQTQKFSSAVGETFTKTKQLEKE
jgi:hypothetical protein